MRLTIRSSRCLSGRVEPESSETPAPKSDVCNLSRSSFRIIVCSIAVVRNTAAGESPAQASGDTGPASTGDQASNSADANPQETKPEAEKADKLRQSPKRKALPTRHPSNRRVPSPSCRRSKSKIPVNSLDLSSLVKDQTLHIHARECLLTGIWSNWPRSATCRKC